MFVSTWARVCCSESLNASTPSMIAVACAVTVPAPGDLRCCPSGQTDSHLPLMRVRELAQLVQLDGPDPPHVSQLASQRVQVPPSSPVRLAAVTTTRVLLWKSMLSTRRLARVTWVSTLPPPRRLDPSRVTWVPSTPEVGEIVAMFPSWTYCHIE